MSDPLSHQSDPDDDPPRRAFLLALVFVAILAVLGFAVVRSVMDLGHLQDCAATGRRDC